MNSFGTIGASQMSGVFEGGDSGRADRALAQEPHKHYEQGHDDRVGVFSRHVVMDYGLEDVWGKQELRS